MNERAKQNTRKADKQDILTLHPCRPSSCELASISASPLGSYRGLAARSRTSSGQSRSHARAGQSRESGTQAAHEQVNNASRNYRQLHTGETPDPLCPCAIDCRARELRFCRQHAISVRQHLARDLLGAGRCCNASEVWLGPIDPGYFFNPLGEGTLPWVFRRGTGNPPNRVQTPLKQAPEGRGETTKPGATAEPAARQKNACVPR